MKTAIVLGASGLTGSHLLQLLLNNSDYNEVIIFVRKTIGLNHPKLTEHVICFDKISDYSDKIKCNDMFCCLGTTIKKAGSQANFKKVDLEYPIQFAQIAKQNGVEHFLMISSIGATVNTTNFYLHTKGECEEGIKKLNFSSTSIFRPSLLLGKRQEFRFGEKIGSTFMKILAILMIGGLKKYRPIQSEQVAKAMLRIAQQKNSGYKIYESDRIRDL